MKGLSNETKLVVIEEGEANFYAVFDDEQKKWLARIQFNGELLVAQQKDYTTAFLLIPSLIKQLEDSSKTIQFLRDKYITMDKKMTMQHSVYPMSYHESIRY